MTGSWQQFLRDSNLSEQTQNLYISQIQKIIDETERPVEWILSHPEETIRMFDNLSESVKRNRLCAICSLFKHWPQAQSVLEEERARWCELHKTFTKRSAERIVNANATEREVVNWVPWKQVLKTEELLGKTEYASQRHLLLAMYTHIEPVRGDYGNVRIYMEEPQEPSCDDEKENYIHLSASPGRSTLCLNRYKTCRKYGRFSRTIPDSLVAIVRKSLFDQPRDYLFVNTAGEPYTLNNSFVKFANRIFYGIFNKHMTISLLRHSFISAIDFNQSRPADLVQVSKNMMHSMAMQQFYRREIPEMEIALQSDDPERKKKKKKKKKKRKPVASPGDNGAYSGKVIII
ncbi:MAG: hypothetical protein ACO35C_06645 [Pontimonas sp.]